MQPLNYDERKYIEFSLRIKRTYRYIGKILGRPHTTISREVKRNTQINKKYSASHAQKLTNERQRRKRLGGSKIDKDLNLFLYIKEKLKDDWPPDVIAGVMKKQKPPQLKGAFVCTESIYRFIYHGNGRDMGWFNYLPYKRVTRIRNRSRKPNKTSIAMRIPIHLRSSDINNRKRVGDWESDSVEYQKQKEGLSVQYERKIKLVRIHKIKNLTAKETTNAIVKTIESVPEKLMRSITLDNGKEGAHHYTWSTYAPNLETFFCDPYSWWQKGGVENINGIIRRYLPKDTDLSKLTDYDIYCLQEHINDIPRKSLNYFSPNHFLATIN